MSDVNRQAIKRKKASTSTISHQSLVLPTTPTLANPTNGFTNINRDRIPTATEVSTELENMPAVGDVIQAKPLSHDISRMSVLRPQRDSIQQTTENLAIQRDETSSLPPVPNYQLSPPSLLQPPDPASRYSLGMDTRLQLDPQIQAMAMQYAQQQLQPSIIRPALNQINLGLPANLGAGGADTPNPFATPTPSAAAPLVPAGAGPQTPRTGTPGDLLRAIMAVPTIDSALTSLQTQVSDRISQDWRRLSTGEQVAVVSTTALIGISAIAGVLSDPNTRQFALNQLNGQTFPVPKANWLRLEINTSGDNLMLGMHVDIGRLLPPQLGFGASSPRAIGAPPER
ncbi:hypothetical protein NIES22_15120 [Calothrix brevissima NIES-22]|nr:hypothetical protein NIES22_15120 [Calothrix brevissima NIES-22]